MRHLSPDAMPAPRQHWRGYQIIFKKNIKDFLKKKKKKKKKLKGWLSHLQGQFWGSKNGGGWNHPHLAWGGLPTPRAKVKKKKKRFWPEPPPSQMGVVSATPKTGLGYPLGQNGSDMWPKGVAEFFILFFKKFLK
jgi:hypothetical protein